MIILIGGSSHVGKTLLAQKLMERTGYPPWIRDGGYEEEEQEDDDDVPCSD